MPRTTAPKVHVDHPVQVLDVHGLERAPAADPRVVDQHVAPPELGRHAVAELGELIELGHVAPDRERRTTLRRDPLGERLEAFEPSGREHHPGARPAEPERGELAEARRGAGHDHDRTTELHVRPRLGSSLRSSYDGVDGRYRIARRAPARARRPLDPGPGRARGAARGPARGRGGRARAQPPARQRAAQHPAAARGRSRQAVRHDGAADARPGSDPRPRRPGGRVRARPGRPPPAPSPSIPNASWTRAPRPATGSPRRSAAANA